jgi:hypothetical protein
MMTAQVFEIVVRGRMGPELAGALRGVSAVPGDDGFTRLVGELPDQSALLGLLTTLADLHIDVVSVNPALPPAGGEPYSPAPGDGAASPSS